MTIYGKRVERVKFRYLGRKLTADGQDVEEVKARMAAARGGMAQLMLPLHRRSAASARTKLAVFRTVSMAQLVYASQTESGTQKMRRCSEKLGKCNEKNTWQ